MKYAFGVLALTAAFSLTSCDSATSKIKDNTENTATSSMEDAGASNAVTASDVTAQGNPVFTFEETSFDFGNIDEGTVAEHVFSFTNTGDAPLIISNARGSCGCTVPEWPRTPIAPGATGSIKVSFNSSGKPGNQKKTVTITANTVPNTKILNISAQVAPKAQN